VIASRGQAGPALLAFERAQAARRLSMLVAQLSRLDDWDDIVGECDLTELRDGVARTLAKIEDIDRQLADGGAAVDADRPTVMALIPTGKRLPLTPGKRLAAARQQLGVLLRALAEVPDGCSDATRNLRKAIDIALGQIADAKRQLDVHLGQREGPQP
jgi:hypothetical protein